MSLDWRRKVLKGCFGAGEIEVGTADGELPTGIVVGTRNFSYCASETVKGIAGSEIAEYGKQWWRRGNR